MRFAPCSLAIFALFIISKSGGLIYNREFHAGLQKLSSNDLLMLAGSFHGMHAITKQLCPNPPVPPAPSSAPAANLAPPLYPSRNRHRSPRDLTIPHAMLSDSHRNQVSPVH
ncbi:uncharacterized protein N0V89_011410 [Didymosphaeria variabile]|uniref:Trafficking protein particle complex subunit n=1 Tax=Didymosphaeria variabile TaxID=1932322 RepID=A0A9W8XB34_9PLEO|nr:uncharacterized protein N0V89_011410 [Didymosphaeria variabile]KAJ4345280.1 hypothetical protein N0V89_011410 [Didymosphaeria variabile]